MIYRTSGSINISFERAGPFSLLAVELYHSVAEKTVFAQ